jgi:hypothetical protein
LFRNHFESQGRHTPERDVKGEREVPNLLYVIHCRHNSQSQRLGLVEVMQDQGSTESSGQHEAIVSEVYYIWTFVRGRTIRRPEYLGKLSVHGALSVWTSVRGELRTHSICSSKCLGVGVLETKHKVFECCTSRWNLVPGVPNNFSCNGRFCPKSTNISSPPPPNPVTGWCRVLFTKF